MTNRDYTQEIGLASPKKTMPRPLAYAILALVAVGVSFGVAGVRRAAKEHHDEETRLKTPAKAAASQAIPAVTEAPAKP